ncbi:MAG: MoxR family ATPase [Acidobacteriota bacterium]|nr:MoxR family ATPase [Acidobacteriota bacterium]
MDYQQAQNILSVLEKYLLGKRKPLEYALACLLVEGHLLIEDVPGVGKTTLAKSLAMCIEADFKRVQFTSDLLPGDLIGVTVFHQPTAKFEFQPGPIFTNVLLADEINRANPKTQSALLEAMHDAQISHDGKTTELPDPFFVIATQNSRDNHGTFPLPESQLDRFLMRLHLGYPDETYEKQVIRGDYLKDPSTSAKVHLDSLRRIRQQVKEIHVSDEVLGYIYRIVAASREHEAVKVGVSPRGGQALYRACQGLAFVRGRDFVIPDDVSELALPVCGHRMMYTGTLLAGDPMGEGLPQRIVREILTSITQPV